MPLKIRKLLHDSTKPYGEKGASKVIAMSSENTVTSPVEGGSYPTTTPVVSYRMNYLTGEREEFLAYPTDVTRENAVVSSSFSTEAPTSMEAELPPLPGPELPPTLITEVPASTAVVPHLPETEVDPSLPTHVCEYDYDDDDEWDREYEEYQRTHPNGPTYDEDDRHSSYEDDYDENTWSLDRRDYEEEQECCNPFRASRW